MLAPFRRIIQGTGSLAGGALLASITGFLFWWVAARTFDQPAVGLAGAAVSAMLLLGRIGVLGLGTTLVGVLHREERPATLALTALLTCGTAGTVLGMVFALVAPLLSAELAPVGTNAIVVALFAVGAGLTSLTAVLDQLLVGAFHNMLQLLRNAVFSFGKLLLLIPAAFLATGSGMLIYAAWTLGAAVSLLIAVPLLVRNVRSKPVLPLMWRELTSMGRDVLSNHILNLSRSTPMWILPILVTVILSSEANASFYIAMMLASFVGLLSAQASFTLYIVAAREPHILWAQMRFTLAISIAAAMFGTMVLTAAGQPILSVFGQGYAASAYPTVAVLAAATFPLAVKDHWIAIQRVQGGVARAAGMAIFMVLIEIGAGALGGRVGGMVGVAVGWLAILVVESVFMVPSMYRALQAPARVVPTA